VAKSGGAYVPVDPDQAAERTSYILETAAPVCVLTNADAEFSTDVADVVRIDELDLSGVDAAPVTDADRVGPLRPENTAYVIFTSGSTGRPKGVAVPHGAIANQLQWKSVEFGLDAADAILLKTAATFDLSVWEFWSAAVCGGRLVIASPDGHRDPAYLNELMAQEWVTTLHVVPSMLDALLTAGMPDSLWRVRWPSGSCARTPAPSCSICMVRPRRRCRSPATVWVMPIGFRCLLVRRSGTVGCMCWMGVCVRFRWVFRVSCIWLVRSWRAVISVVRI
jgi:acyl-CoA synthetase (AMP-forming)/AMP-acid ligase II